MTSDPGVEQRKPVTMRRVAEIAGVSMATVSRVLNGSGPVDPHVAERVRYVMGSLNYQPNRAARALASSRSNFIGLLIGDLQNPFFTELIRGIEEEVRRSGYLLIMCNNPVDARVEEQQQYLEILAAAPVAGAIIIPMQERIKALDLFKARHIPVVTIDQRIRDRSFDSVRIDNVAAAREAVTHLIKNGYRRIAVVSGPRVAATAKERITGYHEALQEAGIELDPQLERMGSFLEETGQSATQEFLKLDPPIEAIFATNNRLTIGALRELYRQHKRVPEDIGLMGFDEIRWAIPEMMSISTIIQPAYEIGRTAANRLIQRLRHPNEPRHEIILPHQLIIGESSRPRKTALESAPSNL